MTTLWQKVVAWFTTEEKQVEVFLSKEEQMIMELFQPIMGAGEATLMQDLITFIRGVLLSGQTAGSLDAWETIVLNGLTKLGGELLDLAKSMGSNALQALIGLALSQLPKPN